MSVALNSPTEVGKNYPLNLKDNSAYFDLRELYDAGVSSLKIEGRIKEFEYVYLVVNTWRKQIENFNKKGLSRNDLSPCYLWRAWEDSDPRPAD